MALVRNSQQYVTGDVRLKLGRGNCTVVGRRSPYSLYQHALATYDRGDAFDHQAALGFIKLWGLPLQIQAHAQLLEAGNGNAITPPPIFGALDTPATSKSQS